MTTLFTFHDLLQVRLEAPKGAFRDYFEEAFAHGRQEADGGSVLDVPTLNVSVDAPLATDGVIWALGKGLFLNQDTQEILLSRDRNTSFFDPRDIYASLTNMLDPAIKDMSVRLKPGVLLGKDVDSYLRDTYRRFVKMDPRNQERRNAETFVSQILDPNLFRLYLRTGHLLLHAAGLEKDGHGVFVFGTQNIGKTTVTIQLCKHGWRMLGDDLCLLDENAGMLSYAKPLKLEKELLENSSEAYRAAKEARNKLDVALTTMRSKIRRSTVSVEVKVPPSALGIDVVSSADVRMAFFLQRGANMPAHDKVKVEALSTDDAVTLCEQHIAAEYDGNKTLDRDIRQNLAIHFKTAGSLSMVTPEVSDIIRKSFSNVSSYMITTSRPDVDTVGAIESTVLGLEEC